MSGKLKGPLGVLLGAAGLIAITMGLRQTFGLYQIPATAQLVGVTSASFSLAIAGQNLIWGLLSPIFGGMADRYGAARVAATGGLLYAAGLSVMGASGNVASFAVGQALIGMGLAGAGFSVALGAVGKAAPAESRSLWLGIATAAGSIGQFVVLPPTQAMISSALLGWRGSLVVLAAVAALMIPLALMLRAPRVAPGQGAAAVPSASALTEACRALTDRSYLLLLAGFFVCGFQVVFVATHLPVYLRDADHDPGLAAWALALDGLFNIMGTLACGWAGSRYSKKNLLSFFYIARSLVIIAYIVQTPTVANTLLFGAAIGFLWLGTVPLTSGLVAVFFGTRRMSMLYGIVFLSHQLGSFMGAWLGGVLYDYSGSHDWTWQLAILLGFAAAVIHYPIKERPSTKLAFANA